MRRIAASLALFAGLLLATDAYGQVPNFPQTLPANTAVGRLGIGPGPAQAIPFSILTTNLLRSLCTTNAAVLQFSSSSSSWTCATISGDATLAAGGALTIANAAVTNAKRANMAANTISCNATGGAAAPTDCVGTTAAPILGANEATAEAGIAINSLNTPQGTAQYVIANTQTAGRNIVGRNGGMEVWQRDAGSSANIAVAASTVAYTVDGWYLATGANGAAHVSAQTGLTNGSILSARVQKDSGQTGTALTRFGFPLDGASESAKTRGLCLVLSFNVSTGANWSPASGTLNYNLYVGTGAAAKRNATLYTSETNPITGSTSIAAGTGNTRVVSSISTAAATTTGQAEVQFSWTPVGTASTNDWFQLDDVQLEGVPCGIAAVAPVFERPDFGASLILNQRHFAKTFPYGTAPAQNAGVVGALEFKTAAANISHNWIWQFPTSMRIIPTITTYNPSAANANARNTSQAADLTISVDPNTAKSQDRVWITTSTAATAAGDNGTVHVSADAGI